MTVTGQGVLVDGTLRKPGRSGSGAISAAWERNETELPIRRDRRKAMSFMRPVIEEFTKAEGDDYMVCQDCLMMIANGECEEPDDGWSPEKMCDANLVVGDDERNEEFSRDDCDCCGSVLAGSRHHCVDMDSIEHREIFRWRLSAPGYLDCTEWSEAETVMDAVDDCLGMHGDEFDEEDYRDLAAYVDGFDDFLRGYLYGLAFTGWKEGDEGDSDEESLFDAPGQNIRDVVDVDREVWGNLGEDARLEILASCLGFLVSAEGLVDEDQMEKAGGDFHLTRNGHGAGFWDGDWVEHGEKLTELSKPWGSCELVLGNDGVMRLVN